MARHITSIDDLTNEEILRLFELADRYMLLLHDERKRGVKRPATLQKLTILATLFFEPSTRTRLSFESAMLRLGGQVISTPDAGSTSATKGETVADTVRVIEHYADLIVLRHPREGAAKVAADFSSVPVVNAGDGSHEHPTQTLCDLYTLHREKGKLAGLNVCICGDLKHGRTVHSLAYGLVRFGANVDFDPAPGLELPLHVRHRMLDEQVPPEIPGQADSVDALYQSPDLGTKAPERLQVHALYATPRRPNQLALFSGDVDVFYVTRLQRERLQDPGATKDYPAVTPARLKDFKYRNTAVLHPLPRVDELGYDMDQDPRGIYFRQASYGVPIRMALLAGLLGLERVLDASAPQNPHPTYSRKEGMRCSNDRCISNDVAERRHLGSRFRVLNRADLVLRCDFCDHEVSPPVIGSLRFKKYDNVRPNLQISDLDNLVFFESESQARAEGYVFGRFLQERLAVKIPS